MKTALISVGVLLLGLSFGAKAQADLDLGIERKIVRLSKMLDSGRIDDLRARKKEELNQILREAIKLVRGKRGGELPRPNPRPRPTPRPRMIEVIGHFENREFNYSGGTSAQIFNACIRDLEMNRTSKADDIYVSVNGHMPVHKRNGPSYWDTPDAMCSVVENAVEESSSKGHARSNNFVEGKVEETHFSYNGTPVQIYNQCIAQIASNAKVDDVYISVNGSRREHIRNGPSYWEGNKAICSLITSKL